MGSPECVHMKLHLRGLIAESCANRTSQACEAASFHTKSACSSRNVGGASLHIVPRRAERPDRAGRQARLANANVARVAAGAHRRKIERDGKQESGAEGMPEAEARMDVEADGGDEPGARPPRPGEEGQRRLVEGIGG